MIIFARLSKIIIPVKFARIPQLSKSFRSVNLQNAIRRSALLTFSTCFITPQYVAIPFSIDWASNLDKIFTTTSWDGDLRIFEGGNSYNYGHCHHKN